MKLTSSKWTKDTNTIFKRRNTNVYYAFSKCSITLATREIWKRLQDSISHQWEWRPPRKQMTANSCVGVGNEETPYTIDYKLATTLWASVWRLLKTPKYSRAGPLLCGHPKTATAHHRDLRIHVYCCSWYSSKQTKSVCVAISKWPDKGSQKDKHCVPSVTRGSLTLTVRYAYRGVRKCGWKLEKGCLWLEKDALSEGCEEDNGTK